MDRWNALNVLHTCAITGTRIVEKLAFHSLYQFVPLVGFCRPFHSFISSYLYHSTPTNEVYFHHPFAIQRQSLKLASLWNNNKRGRPETDLPTASKSVVQATWCEAHFIETHRLPAPHRYKPKWDPQIDQVGQNEGAGVLGINYRFTVWSACVC